MTESDLLDCMDALRADAANCNAKLRRDGQLTILNTDSIPTVLRFLSDGPSRSMTMAAALGYRQRVLNSRLHYMVEKGLVDRIAHGTYAITDKGRETLEKDPDHG